ncbi:MAG: ABC transporter substrate-binding protein [Chloroflexota bacterium]
MIKQHLIKIVVLIVLFLLSACTVPVQTENSAADSGMAAVEADDSATRGVLQMPHFLYWNGQESLDPASPVDFTNATILLYDRLVRLDADGVPQPELATAWHANDDATEWTFTLREDVTFHDGKAFSSADVAYTFEHILDPDFASPLLATLGLIEAIETPDTQTIVFQLNQGHADFPLLLIERRAAIIPEGSSETINTSGIGTGPFVLENLDVEGVTVFRANDNYWKGISQLAGIELFALADAEARTTAALAGQADILLDVTPDQVALFDGNDDFTILRFSSGRWTTLVMRTDTPPFDDVMVRQAMRLVADRQEIINLVLDGEGTVSCDTPVSPADAYRRNDDCEQDIEQAKALLAEAGYADGLEVTLYAANIDPQLIPLAEVYQQQAAQAGITVNIEIMPPDSYWSEVWMVQPFVTSYWNERTADQVLNEGWRSGAAWNESFFQNAEFDQLLDAARTELDFEQRQATYQAAQQMLLDEGGNLIPYHVNQFYVVRSNIVGVSARSWFHMDWHTIQKSE